MFSYSQVPAPYKDGDIVFADSFKNEKVFKERWSGAIGSCSLTEDGLKIVKGSAEKGNTGLIQISLPLERLRGAAFSVKARVKGENVSSPAKPAIDSTRFLFMMKVNGTMMYNTVDLPTGTFDWRDVEMNVFVPDETNTVEGGTFKLGLDKSTGTWWVRDVSITVSKAALPVDAAVSKGPRYKGHNLPALRGVTLPNKFTEQDYSDLAKWNVNCGRWNIGNWNGSRFPGGLAGKDFDALFDKEVANTDVIVKYAEKYGIYIVLCMGGSSPKFGLFDSPQNQTKFIECWKRLAERYKNNKAVVMYDLANEPHESEWKKENGVKTYDELMMATALAIREMDPVKCIAVETGVGGSNVRGFYTMKPFPASIPNVVYAPHMYAPMAVTHQGVYGSSEGVSYPGCILDGVTWDKAQLERSLKPAIDFQKRYNVQMFIGEFGCVRWAPDGSAARWLADAIEIFEKYNWDWSYHAFRESDLWDPEYMDGTHDMTRPSTPSGREKVLRGYFDKNQKPEWYKKN